MIKQHVEKFFNKIPKNAKIGIYGISNISRKIYQEILSKRKDVKVLYFIEKQENEKFENLPVISLNEFVNNKKGCNFVIVASFSDMHYVNNILSVYDMPFVPISKFIYEYFEGKHAVLNDKNYKNVKKIFNNKEDKKIFDLIFKRRVNILSDEDVKKYYDKKYYKCSYNNRVIKEQYLEKINKNKVKYILDLGYNSGFNSIAYNKLLPNLKKTYGFEAIYDICKNKFIESFILNDKLELVEKAIGEENSKTKFFINIKIPSASISDFSVSAKEKTINQNTHKEIEVDVVTIDDYCKENNIKPDLIKMDIEGAELPALKGGMKTIRKYRPQLAISIYHCDRDYVEIPLYLKQNLENYEFKIGHYAPDIYETILYAIPYELI